jgi:hypothetical protein
MLRHAANGMTKTEISEEVFNRHARDGGLNVKVPRVSRHPAI